MTFSHSMTSYLRRAAKSGLKALCFARDLSEKKRHSFNSFIKIDLAEVSTVNNASLRTFEAMLNGTP